MEAISKLDNGIITVKKIRTLQQVKSSNRSRINFMWRSLAYLVEKGILEENGSQRPKSYRKTDVYMDVKHIIAQAEKDLNRRNLN